MLTVNQLAKKYKLSRSALLYYDKIGLLKPSVRSQSNYRLYTAEDDNRLRLITTYRDTGLSLKAIANILQAEEHQSAVVPEKRLLSLNTEISNLRKQQQLIIELLGAESLFRSTKTMNKDQWVKILRASGMDEDAMHKWHIEFERDLPEMHQDFLESLGCDAEEVKRIRQWSKQ